MSEFKGTIEIPAPLIFYFTARVKIRIRTRPQGTWRAVYTTAVGETQKVLWRDSEGDLGLSHLNLLLSQVRRQTCMNSGLLAPGHISSLITKYIKSDPLLSGSGIFQNKADSLGFSVAESL